MRIAYYLTWSLGNELGPGEGQRKKISDQLTRWRSQGVEARLFLAASRPCGEAWAKNLSPAAFQVTLYRHKLEQLWAHYRIHRQVKAFAPDLVYLRQEMWSPGLGLMLRSHPAVLELNGDEFAEGVGARFSYRWHQKLSRWLVLSAADGLVSVARELLNIPAFARASLPRVVIANGIAIDDFSPLPAPVNERPRLAFMGAHMGGRWHGVEKLVELARQRPEWDFDVIGMGPAEMPGAPVNVTGHGVLRRPDYERVLSQADVAFGTLSAYEKQCWEASPLKVREYLAYGIPTITGVHDTDFPQGCPGFLEIENCPGNVVPRGLDRIDAFVAEWKGRRVARADVAHLDSRVKEERRLSFFAEVLSQTRERAGSARLP